MKRTAVAEHRCSKAKSCRRRSTGRYQAHATVDTTILQNAMCLLYYRPVSKKNNHLCRLWAKTRMRILTEHHGPEVQEFVLGRPLPADAVARNRGHTDATWPSNQGNCMLESCGLFS
jgi:hypothetical protein